MRIRGERAHGSPAVRPERLAAYLEGEVTRSEAEAIETELADSARLRRQLGSLRQIRDALAAPVPELQGLDLVASLPRSLQAPPRRSRPGLRSWPTAVPAAAVGLVAVGILLFGQLPQEFRPKSAGSPALERDKWAGVQVYRVAGAASPELLGSRMSAGDGLLFAYTNLGARPFDHLMIFGIDARGEVRWYYPAYEREGTNPESIALSKGEANVRLPQLVYHDYAPGPLALHALFSTRPWRVLEIEARLRAQKNPASPLTMTDAVDQVLTIRVDP